MVLMDDCIHNLYCKCIVSYDTAVSRAYNPERITSSTACWQTASVAIQIN